MDEVVHRQVLLRDSSSMVCKSGCSKYACGAAISYVPSFLDDRLLFCCWPPEAALLAVSWEEGLPVPALSIFSISFSTRVPFYITQTQFYYPDWTQ